MVPFMATNTVAGSFADAAAALVETGRRFYQRGWVQGTSGNFSAVVNAHPLTLCITPSAAHKGMLAASDFLKIDEAGRPTSDHNRPPFQGRDSGWVGALGVLACG